MILLDRAIPPNCDIVLHGDTHDGNSLMCRKKLDSLLDWILADKHRYFVHMGDETDAITTDDKRYSHETCDQPIPLEQRDSVVEQYWRARRRCIAWLNGNHNQKLARFGNITADICRALGVPYGSWTCKLRLHDKQGQILKMFLTHGFRGTINSNAKDHMQRAANLKAGMRRKLENKAADCLLMAMGHTHKLMVAEPARRLILGDDGTAITQNYLAAGRGDEPYIEPDARWYVNTGTFLGLYQIGVDSYAEQAGYDPNELGYAVARIRHRRLIAVEPVVI